MGFLVLLYTYILGGITFLPLVLLGIWYSLPIKRSDEDDISEPLLSFKDTDDLDQDEKSVYDNIKAGAIDESLNSGVEAYMMGWITVTKEYLQTSASLNGQPINEAPENKSAYSSLYKLVNKGNNAEPANKLASLMSSTAASQSAAEANKKLKNAHKKHRYYGVLRHGNLFLYKDEHQTDVQHVIVLANHIIAVWPRGLLEGELFGKRSAICIMKKDYRRASDISPPLSSAASLTTQSSHGASVTLDLLQGSETDSKKEPPKGTFFLYTDFNIDKEDWYFSLLRATKKDYLKTGTDKDLLEPSLYAKTMHFKTADILTLIQKLHSSEGQLHTKWLNALLGRIFLSLQQTEVLKNFVQQRLGKKLQKIRKPGFLDEISITKVNVGNAAPLITYPQLKELSPDGNLLLATNFHYSGNISIQVATKLTISLGGTFKKREVSLLLAITLKKIEGRVLLKIKPPPTDRIWYGFEKEPKIDLEVEPIVSSRQITYGLVTKYIENKLKEAIKDSLVLPHMDDIMFFNTSDELFRGGIWDKSDRPLRKEDIPDSASLNLDINANDNISLNEIEEFLQEAEMDSDSTAKESVNENAFVSKLPGKRSSTYNGSSSSPIKLTKEEKHIKSSTTIGFSNDQYLADGSFVPLQSASSGHSLSDDESTTSEEKKKYGLSTIKKIGRWYFKDEKNPGTTSPSAMTTSSVNSPVNYRPPEMIQSRRAPRKLSSAEAPKTPLLSAEKENSYEMFNKSEHDLNNSLNLPPPIPPRDRTPRSPSFSQFSVEEESSVDSPTDIIDRTILKQDGPLLPPREVTPIERRLSRKGISPSPSLDSLRSSTIPRSPSFLSKVIDIPPSPMEDITGAIKRSSTVRKPPPSPLNHEEERLFSSGTVSPFLTISRKVSDANIRNRKSPGGLSDADLNEKALLESATFATG